MPVPSPCLAADRAAERVLATRRDFLAALLDPENRGRRPGLRSALAAEFPLTGPMWIVCPAGM